MGSKKQFPIQTTYFSSAESFLFTYADNKTWDILLLDIEMGKMNGMTMAKQMRKDFLGGDDGIILVEPTASLDPIAEAEIYERFSSIVEGTSAV